MEPETRLLFSDIAVECTPEYLRVWIEAKGYSVSTVKLIRDNVSGTSPSFAYVQLMDGSRLDEAARSLHGQKLLGRPVCASEVVPLQAAVKPASAWRATG